METSDLTIEILKSIRDEIRGTNTRLDETNKRLDATNNRLDESDARAERHHHRLIDTEIRLSTEIVAVAAAVREVRDDLRRDRGLSRKVEDHEHRIEALEKRTG